MGNVDVTGLSLVTAQPAAAHHHLALTWVLCHIALSTVSAAFVAALPCHQTGTAVRQMFPLHRAPATGKGHARDEGRPRDWRALGAAAHLRLIASHHYYCMARRRNTPATKHQPHSLIEGSGLTSHRTHLHSGALYPYLAFYCLRIASLSDFLIIIYVIAIIAVTASQPNV